MKRGIKMAQLPLSENFTASDVLDAAGISRWLAGNRIAQGKLPLQLSGKVTTNILSTLAAKSAHTGLSFVDETISWLRLYSIQKFGVKNDRCVTDVTTHLPIAGMVQGGIDVPLLFPTLAGSAVGLNTIKDFAGDYILTPSEKKVGKNGLLSLHNRPTIIVTNRDLIDLGMATPPPKPEDPLVDAAYECRHKTPEVWCDRVFKIAVSKGLLKEGSMRALEVRYPSLARMLREKIAKKL